MSAAIIAQLIIALGPSALGLIQDLAAVWTKPVLTSDEVLTICKKLQKLKPLMFKFNSFLLQCAVVLIVYTT